MTAGIRGIDRLSARKQLAVLKDYPGLIPGLCARGLGLEDAAAVAHNATVLYYALEIEPKLSSPEDVLNRLSLEEIALYGGMAGQVQEGELEVAWSGGEAEP